MSESAGEATEAESIATSVRDQLVFAQSEASTLGGRFRRALFPVVRRALRPVHDGIEELAVGLQVIERDRRTLQGQTARELAGLRAEVDSQRREMEHLRGWLAGIEQEQLNHRAVVRELSEARIDPGSSAAVALGPTPESVLDAAGYVEFERRFRGSQEEVRARADDALRWVAHLAHSDAVLVDLGCGRGEWLAAVDEAGIKAYGVDSNPEMVRTGRDSGLDLRLADLVTYTEELEPGSVQAITAFHVAEHLPLAALAKLLRSCARALAPGGVLLMETPNPMNFVVGTSSFYLDPTHVRPLHPYFFQFLAEQSGFEAAELHWVHPADGQALLAADCVEQPMVGRVLEAVSVAVYGAQDFQLVARRVSEASSAPPDAIA